MRSLRKKRHYISSNLHLLSLLYLLLWCLDQKANPCLPMTSLSNPKPKRKIPSGMLTCSMTPPSIIYNAFIKGKMKGKSLPLTICSTHGPKLPTFAHSSATKVNWEMCLPIFLHALPALRRTPHNKFYHLQTCSRILSETAQHLKTSQLIFWTNFSNNKISMSLARPMSINSPILLKERQ